MSASVGSTSDWESVGYPDGFAVPCEQESERQKQTTSVVLELPPGMLEEMHQETSCVAGPASTTSSAVLLSRIGHLNLQSVASSTTSRVPSSAARSSRGTEKRFVAYRSRRDDDSSWSCVSSGLKSIATLGTSTATATASVALSEASSVISNFDVLSLSGRVYRRCKRCSYHNSEHAVICIKCDLALIANPCEDQDAQIARNLQQKEEREAFQELQRLERKRKNFPNMPILEQTNYLIEEIQAVTAQLGPPLSMMSHASMTLPTASFIDYFRTHEARVFLAYNFTRDDPATLANIRRNGFEDNTRVSKEVETALNHFNDPGKVRRGESLFSIPENKNCLIEPVIHHSIGWIIAVVEKPSLDTESISFPDGSKCVAAASQILPLVSFPSSERKSDFVQKRAFGRLEQLCEDFFVTFKCDDGEDAVTQSWPRIWPESSSKKAKTSRTNGTEQTTASSIDDDADWAWAIALSEGHVSSPLSSNLVTSQATDAQDVESDEGSLPDKWLDFVFGPDDVHHEGEISCDRSDAPPASPIEKFDLVSIGLQVVILEGSFKGHAGKVVCEDDTHVHVQVETIRSHPTVLVIRDRVELLNG